MSDELPPGPWTVTFDEYGGYDCMSSAYTVRDAKGRSLFEVDCARYIGKRETGESPIAKAVAEAAAQGWSPSKLSE